MKILCFKYQKRENNESLAGYRNAVRNQGESLLDSSIYNSEVQAKREHESTAANNENKK